MGSEGGRESAALIDRLFDESSRFEFFQAVRLLEWSRSDGDEHVAVGYDFEPSDEPVRFRAHASQGFPSSAITALRPGLDVNDAGRPERPAEMTVSFMGLTGPQGVLPDHYTRLVIDRMQDNDHAMREFFDLFNHRFISMFHRAWAKYRLFIEYERTARIGQNQVGPITQAFFCLIGFGTPHLRGRLEIDDETLLYFAGHMAMYRPIALSLELVLCEYFRTAIELQQFYGQWLAISQYEQSRLPALGAASSMNQLGMSAMLGRRIWDVQSKFRVRIGPLDYSQFRSFLPTGQSFVKLCQLVRLYVGPEYDFDVQLTLLASEVPRCRLGGDGSDGSHLGWNTWLCSLAMPQNADHAVLRGEGRPVRKNSANVSASGV
jgi:type VI secretion system protein ImpH